MTRLVAVSNRVNVPRPRTTPAAVTTGTSTGAVNAMHSSLTPLGGLVPLFSILLVVQTLLVAVTWWPGDRSGLAAKPGKIDGQPPPDDPGDILAGPAEGWKVGPNGAVVGVETGQPILLLDDLLVALRSIENTRSSGITCSIDPTAEGLARLQALPGGDATRGATAAGAAVNLFEEDKKKKAAALVLRGGFRQEPEAQLQDYGQAIDLDPSNADAWQARALVHLDQGDADKAIEDFNSLLKQNENNVNAHLALAEALTNLEKLDEALPHIEKAIQLKPDSPLGYTLRARWKVLKEDMDGALHDLDQALKIEPRDVMALVIRARLYLSQDNLAAAKDDVERMLLISPGLVQGILMRSMIYAEEGRVGDAIADIESLLKQDPKNVSWRLQLAGYYIKDRRPSKAIDVRVSTLPVSRSSRATLWSSNTRSVSDPGICMSRSL